MRSNKREGRKPCHIVLTWRREDEYCLGQKAVDEKSDEHRDKRQGCNNRCNGNADGNCVNDTKEMCRLCAGGKGKPGESGSRYTPVF